MYRVALACQNNNNTKKMLFSFFLFANIAIENIYFELDNYSILFQICQINFVNIIVKYTIK